MSGIVYFKPKQNVAHVTVLAQTVRAKTQDKTKYRVRHGCCGTEQEVTHKWIMKRIRDQNKLCRVCNYGDAAKRKRKKPKPPMALKYHGWEPPPTAVQLKRTLC